MDFTPGPAARPVHRLEPQTYGDPHRKEKTEGREGTKLGDTVKGTLTEVKMSRMRKRSDVDQEKKKYSKTREIRRGPGNEEVQCVQKWTRERERKTRTVG
jgi:hypothetical protein